eukprot:g108.t1
MGASCAGGDRRTQATFPKGDGGSEAEVAASTTPELDCPGGQRYLASVDRRKLFTHHKITSILDSVFGSTEVQIEKASGERARFGGQCGPGIDINHRDPEAMQKLHDEASSHVEYLGKTVWK